MVGQEGDGREVVIRGRVRVLALGLAPGPCHVQIQGNCGNHYFSLPRSSLLFF